MSAADDDGDSLIRECTSAAVCCSMRAFVCVCVCVRRVCVRVLRAFARSDSLLRFFRR